jgi:hypothetical protein
VPSYFIVLEEQSPNLDTYVNGNHLSDETKKLERLAKQIGVKPLMSFFSINPQELNSLLGDASPAELGLTPTEEKWFSAEDGLRTIRALTDHFETEHSVANAPLLSELREFEKVLSAAHQKNIRWHLAIDY